MAQRRLDEFSYTEAKPSKEIRAEALPFMEAIAKEKKQRAFPPIAPENLPPSYFVSATYDGKTRKALIKLYEPTSSQIYFWYDNTGHKPYCLTNLSPYELEKINRLIQHPGFDHFEIVEKFDPLSNRNVKVTKIVAKDPLAIGGRARGCIRDIIPEEFPKVSETPISQEEIKVWESKIRYYQSYIYDRNIWPGMIYEVKNGNLAPKTLEEAERMVQHIREIFKDATSEEQQYIEQWARLLEYPAPKFRRVALDIEVYSPIPTRMPDPREAAYQVVCVSLYGSDGQKRILLLKREGVREGTERLPADVTLEYFDSEEKLIRAVFDALRSYPFVITFNGDDFDLRYLAHRAQNFGLRRDEIPIEIGRRVCLLKYGIHIDLYKFFFNRSIQIYAFNNRYRDVTLDDVGRALTGMEKIRLEKSIGELTYTELAKYCFRDAEIAFKLTSFEDDLVMNLILVLARISNMPMEDVSRQGVSRWIRNFIHREHRRRNMLIPNAADILATKGKTATKAIIKGKKYKGAIVVEPVPGTHFNVAVMDFASVDSEEPIIVRRGENDFHQMKIGKFVDSLLPLSTTSELQVADGDGWEVLCFDKEGKISFKPIIQVSRHRWEGGLLKIKTSDGRYIRVTPNHSLFKLDENLKVAPIKVGKLKTGDYIIVPSRLNFPVIYKGKINLLNLLRSLPDEKTEPLLLVFNYGRLSTQWRKRVAAPLQKAMVKKLYYREPQGKRLVFRFNDFRPYLDIIPVDDLHNWRVYLEGKKYKIRGFGCKLILPLKHFAKFLGYYLSEGSVCSTNDSVVIAQENPEIRKDIFNCLTQLGFPFSRQKVGAVLSKSHIVSYLLMVCLEAGKDAYDKSIPSFLFFADKTTKMAFLKAYLNGDGWRYDSGYACRTFSKSLANDLILFLLSLGKRGITIDEKSEKVNKSRKHGKCAVKDCVISYTIRVNDNWDDISITHNRHPSYLFPTALLPQTIRKGIPCKASDGTKRVDVLRQFSTLLNDLDGHLLESLPDEATLSFDEEGRQLIKFHLKSRYGTWWNKLSTQERKAVVACLYFKTVKANEVRLVSDLVGLPLRELNEHVTRFHIRHGSKWIDYPIYTEWKRLHSFLSSDIQVLKVDSVEEVLPSSGFVYDIGVNETNSFISGTGWICAHNSLYPSIMKVWNVGYQSIRCLHKECRDNVVPGTPHWVCRRQRALESLLIGSLRDLRVKWYKPRAKDMSLPTDLRNWYNLIQGALKVILNANYGVFGSTSFDLYCPPAAEATAAIGRHAINKIIGKAKELGVKVLYGDTDSVFLKNPREEQIETLADWSLKELKMSLDVDKVYRYAVFSSRKKNYLGVLEDGSVDVKGLTGKKRHIPLFIKKAFDRMKERLAMVKTPADFENAKKDISEIVRDCYIRLKRREWESLSELAFNVVLGEELERYTKTTPQHVKAAKILKEGGMELKAGDLISFVKVVKEPRVKPVELATKNEIDVDKYIAYLHSTFDQVLDALGLDFDEIIGLTKLERFM